MGSGGSPLRLPRVRVSCWLAADETTPEAPGLAVDAWPAAFPGGRQHCAKLVPGHSAAVLKMVSLQLGFFWANTSNEYSEFLVFKA